MRRSAYSCCTWPCYAIVLLIRCCSGDLLSLRRDRVAACQGIGYAPKSKGLAPFSGSFRTNPLPEALLPRANTVSTLRVQNLSDYIWTLFPYFLASAVLISALLGCCPGCCAFICFSKCTHRSPSVYATGVGFNVAFALLSLISFIAVVVAFEEQSNAIFAYSQAKCALYSTLDTLVNGVPPSELTVGSKASSFVGFRVLMDAIEEASGSFPDVTKSIQSIQHDFSLQANGVNFVNLAQSFSASWKQSHQKVMKGTSFRCSLCGEKPFQVLVDTVGQYRNATVILTRLFDQASSSMADVSPNIKSMELDILTDVTELYRVGFEYGHRLQNLTPQWEMWWRACVTSVRLLVSLSLVCIGLGLVANILCKAEICAFFAWWFTFCHTLALLTLFAVLFGTTVAVNDATGLLSSVVTTPGIETYRSRLFNGLSPWQGQVLSSCINEGGDLRDKMNFSFNVKQMRKWTLLDQTLANARKARLVESRLKGFFTQYTRVDGGTYNAVWNTSQTLAWHGEPNGMMTIANKLQNLSGELWTFRGTVPPDGCALAQPFRPSKDVLSWSCFFVTSTHPTDSEVRDRYVTMSRSQLNKVQAQFQRARTAALALELVQNFAATNKGAATRLQNSWSVSVRIVNRALSETMADVASPLGRFSAHVRALNTGGNCDIVRAHYLTGLRALGQDFVSSHLVLAACCGILAVCSMGLTVLYCLLWSLRQEGRYHSGGNGVSDSEDEASDGYALDDIELEERRPLKQSITR